MLFQIFISFTLSRTVTEIVAMLSIYTAVHSTVNREHTIGALHREIGRKIVHIAFVSTAYIAPAADRHDFCKPARASLGSGAISTSNDEKTFCNSRQARGEATRHTAL